MTTATLPSVHALAALVDMKQASFKDIIPFIEQARMIDLRMSSWYVPTLTVVPAFDLHIGDHVITYDKAPFSNYSAFTILIRSGLVPSKIPGGSGMYSRVEKSECKVTHKRNADKLLAAIKARCTGMPWYNNTSCCSWRFL